MSLITQFFTPKTTDALSAILAELAEHGSPRISKYRSGWLASVTIEDASQGKRIEITSDCNHPEPNIAAEECRIRLLRFIEAKN